MSATLFVQGHALPMVVFETFPNSSGTATAALARLECEIPEEMRAGLEVQTGEGDDPTPDRSWRVDWISYMGHATKIALTEVA